MEYWLVSKVKWIYHHVHPLTAHIIYFRWRNFSAESERKLVSYHFFLFFLCAVISICVSKMWLPSVYGSLNVVRHPKWTTICAKTRVQCTVICRHISNCDFNYRWISQIHGNSPIHRPSWSIFVDAITNAICLSFSPQILVRCLARKIDKFISVSSRFQRLEFSHWTRFGIASITQYASNCKLSHSIFHIRISLEKLPHDGLCCVWNK